MTCKVKFTETGKISKVLTPTGEESELFNKLARFPFNTLDEALELYKQAVDERSLTFESNSGIYDTYKEALKNSQGEDIKLKVGDNKIIQTVSSNTNPNTFQGLINNAIKNDILSDSNIIEDGESYLQADGYDQLKQITNSEIFKDFSNENGYSVNVRVDGRITVINNNNLKDNFDKTYSEVKPKLGEDISVVSLGLGGLVDNMVTMNPRSKRTLIREEDIINNIRQVLNSAGFSITTIDNYIKDFKSKNEVEPNAEALIDLQNKVLAFSEGNFTLNNLTEEFTHFVLEAIDSSEIESALRLVPLTSEYSEFSEIYREAYSKQGLTGEELEFKINKEILGKIVAKGALQQLQPQSQNIFEYVWNRILNFLNSLNLTNNSAFKNASNRLSDLVTKMVVDKDISTLINMDNFNASRFVYYSLNSQPATNDIGDLNAQLKTILRTLQDQERALRKGGRNVKAIEDVMDKILQVESKSSMLATIDFINKQLNYVEKAVNNSKAIGESINAEEAVVLSSLKNHILPSVVALSKIIKKDADLNKLSSNLNDIKVRISDLELTPSANVMDRIIKRTISRYQLPAEFTMNGVKVNTYDYFKDSITALSKDTNFIYAYIGQVSHAKEPLLNMLDSVVYNMVQKSHVNFAEASKQFQNSLKSIGVSERDLVKLYDKDGYILSLFDFSKFEEDKLNIFTDAFLEQLKAQNLSKGITTSLTREDVYNALKNRIEFEPQNRLEGEFKDAYAKNSSDKIAKLRERAYQDEYYTQREEELNSLNLPKEALDKIRQLGFDRADIMSRVDLSSGYPVFKLQDKYDLDAYNSDRMKAKSPYDANGVIKKGVDILREDEFNQRYPNMMEEGKFVYENGFVKVGQNFINIKINATPEAKIAYGISKLDANYIQNNQGSVRESGLTPEFIKQLKNIENTSGKEASNNFFQANVYTSLDDSFYEREFEDEFSSFYESDAVSDEYILNYNRYKEISTIRRELLKHYRDSKSSLNTLASRMPIEVQENVRALTSEMNEKRRLLRMEIGGSVSYESDTELVSDLNEDYKGQLRDLGIENNPKERLNFAMKHVIGSENFSNAFSTLDYMKVGKFPSPFLENLLNRYLRQFNTTTVELFESIDTIRKNDNITLAQKSSEIEGIIDQVKLQIAESRLAPYFKTLTPQGVGSILNAMSDYSQGSKSIATLVSELEGAGIKMSLHNSYYNAQTDNELVNTKFKKGFQGAKEQPKLDLYFNSRFEQKLGVKVKKDSDGNYMFDSLGIPEVVNETPLFKAYRAMMEYHKGTMEATNELGHHNIYIAPQVSKTNMDKIFTTLSGKANVKNIGKEFVKEMLSFRVDEQVQGQTLDNGESLFIKTGLRVVPKRYFTRLETPDDLSNDLFYTMTLMRQDAELHKARKEALTEVTAIEEAIASKRFVNGKSALASSTYKMAKSYIDYNIYGITESINFRTTLPIIGEIDVAKVAKMFHKYIRFKNLAWNLVIPMTSWLTAEANIVIEQAIKQYLDSDSLNEARRQTAKLGMESAREAFNVKTKGRLNVIGQYLGVYDLDATYVNSKMGKVPVALSRLSMGAHTLANYSPIAQAMLSGLIGRRIYGGRFLDKRQFDEAYKLNNPTASDKEINNKWKELKSNSLYTYLDTSSEEGVLKIDYETMAQDMGVENTEDFQKETNGYMTAVSGNIKKFIERIDGNIPQHEKTMLQRNFLGSFLMTHKGWQSIAITNRFKASHYNIQTNQVEEGSYKTLARKTRNVVDGLYNAIQRKDWKEFFTAVKEAYTKADRYEQLNLRRVALDQAFLFGIYAMVLMLSAFTDDDENKDLYMAQMTTYLMERVFNETKSSQLGLLGEITKTVKEPVVGFDNLLKTLDFTKVLNFDRIQRGNYAGMTNSQKYFIDNVPGFKSMYSILSAENIGKQRNSYEHFNGKDEFNPASLIISSDEFKEFMEQ